MIADAFRRWKQARRIRAAEAEILARDIRPRPHGLPGPLIISLTSYPARFSSLHLVLRALLHVAADTGQLPETRDIELSIILNFNPDAGHTVFQAQNIFLSANAQ